MKKILLISALLLTSTHIQAADSCDTGNVYTDLECHETRTAQIKSKLNAAYAELKKYPSFGAAQAFEQSQKLWRQWVEKDCQFENTPNTLAQGGGYGMMMAACKHERYAARLKQVRAVIDELKDSAAER